MQLKELFVEQMELHGWNKAELARQIGQSRMYVQYVLKSDVANPSFENAINIAQAFGMTLEELAHRLYEE